MIALLEAHQAGLFSRRHWLPNLISGVVVGVVALPLAMAFAIASGAKPEQGIYTAIISSILVSALGGSRLQIAGPTGAFIVVLSAITARHGLQGLTAATLMAGFILLALGLARLGAVIRYIPAPVVVGFTAGIAVVIWVGQWRDFLGLPAVDGQHFHEKLWLLLQSFPQTHSVTAILGILSLALTLYAPKIRGLAALPGPLVAMVVVTGLQTWFHFEGVSTIGSAFGGIPQTLPRFDPPDLTLEDIPGLLGPACAIAILGAIESLLSAMVADGMAGTRHDPNQELIGQGLANIVAPLFGGFAATGAIARTATNIRNGGTSPVAGFVHAATLLLTILFLAPLAQNIPLSCLAAILFVVAWNMSDAAHFVKMVRCAPRADIVILFVTFGLTIFADLLVAVNVGVLLAAAHFLRRMAASVEVAEAPETHSSSPAPGVVTLTLQGPFFFAAVENFPSALAQAERDPAVLILRLKWVPFVDFTGLQTLETAIRRFHARGARVLLSGANPRVEAKLRRAGILTLIGEGSFFATYEQALAAAAPLSSQ